MRGTIVEKKGKHWIVMDDRGVFCKVAIDQARGLDIGDPIEIKVKKPAFDWRTATSVALIALFMVGGWIYQVPYGFMVVDINPSTELVYNRFQRIIDVNALNKDAEGMLELGLKHDNLENAIKKVVEKAREDGHLGEEGFVLLTSQEDNDRLDEAALVEALYEELMDEGLDLVIAALESSESEYNAAKGIGVSPGKAILREEIRERAGQYEGANVGQLIREMNRLTKPTPEDKEAARLYMQEQKRQTMMNEEKGEKIPPGQAKKEDQEKGQNAHGQDSDKERPGNGGSKGKQESQGSQESQGEQESQGDQGENSQGNSGNQESQGNQDSQGNQESQGSQGNSSQGNGGQ